MDVVTTAGSVAAAAVEVGNLEGGKISRWTSFLKWGSFSAVCG